MRRHLTSGCVKLNVSPEAGVAQLVEQLIRNQQVIGSSPIAGSNFRLTSQAKIARRSAQREGGL
jgi:hypothetical protein